VVGGRSKYFINGSAAQASRVQTLFHSVQLNVNNPHFLIMQGRITKVLNMKPMEVLGMLEEAAGTRMYEDKKRSAERVIEKKEGKVAEINAVLADEINPKLKELRKQQADYTRYKQNQADMERHTRLLIAHEWFAATAVHEEAVRELDGVQEAASRAEAEAARLRAVAESREARVAELEDQRRAEMGPEYRRRADDEALKGKTLAEAEARLASAEATLEEERRGLAKARAAAEEAEALTQALVDRMASLEEEDGDLRRRAEAARAEYEEAEAAYEAACTGVAAAGARAGEGGGTIQGRMMQAREAAAGASARAETASMRSAHLRAEAEAALAGLRGSKKAFDGLEAQAVSARGAATEAEAALERLAAAHDPKAERALRTRRDRAAAEADKLASAADAEAARLGSRLSFEYDEAAMGKRWDASVIRGVVARLVRVADDSAATALEVAAGGRLWQVVVETAEASAALLKRGRLQRRYTFVPLDRISARAIPEDRAARAAALTGGRAVPALSLVAYDDGLEAAMRHAFGRALVCEDKDAAKACAFDRSVGCVSVTKEGDVYDPAGTLEGGSRNKSAGILLRAGRLAELQERLGAARAELAAAERELAAAEAAGAALEEARAERDVSAHRLRMAEERLSSCEYAEAKAKADAASAEADEQDAEAARQRAEAERAASLIASLEGDAGDEEGRREREEKEAERRLAKAKKAAAKAEKATGGAAQRAEEKALELAQATKDAAEARTAVEAAGAAVEAAEAGAEKAAERAEEARRDHAAADAALGRHRARVAETDELLRSVLCERDEAREAADANSAEAKGMGAEVERLESGRREGAKTARKLVREHPWIEDDRATFGQAGTAYDFRTDTPGEAREELARLREAQETLRHLIDLKAGEKLEQGEKEYDQLVGKKDRIEGDKRKIRRVIAELDQKKVEALDTTWRRVNRDFASIFSTLLPGTSSRLVPVAEAAAAAALDDEDDEDDAGAAAAASASASSSGAAVDLTSGLEIRVAFGGVWKESLTELSGGQRSLLALSLILAMLLFKPAPVYILDEVDAALDLSHTQNIGRMLRTHFRGSQFLVVSLKQGMFSNANVIFRTKFVDGVSTVTRTTGRRAEDAEAAPRTGKAAAAAAASSSSGEALGVV